jgi:hypothetical protein
MSVSHPDLLLSGLLFCSLALGSGTPVQLGGLLLVFAIGFAVLFTLGHSRAFTRFTAFERPTVFVAVGSLEAKAQGSACGCYRGAMKELWFWRVATAIACIGWGLTWWTADADPVALKVESSAEELQAEPSRVKDRRLGRGKIFRQLGSGSSGGKPVVVPLEPVPGVQVSEESMELARQELATDRQQRFIARMEERHTASLESLDDFSEQHGLSDDEIVGVEEAIDLRFVAMGEAYEGEGMEPDARREHMKAVADAFEMHVVGALGEEVGALYLEQVQRPSWGRIGRDKD